MEKTKRPTKKPATSSRRIPIQDNKSNVDQILQKKLSQVVELQNGIEILRNRMNSSKRDLLMYFSQNPQLKTPKYAVGERYVRYIDKKNNDGLSQKLIIKGLSEYFRQAGVKNVEDEVSKALDIILDQRNSKIVPTIDISKDQSSSVSSTNEIDDDNETA